MGLYAKMKGPVGYTVVGSPTITDGVVSGFLNRTNYLEISSQVIPFATANSWEIKTAIIAQPSDINDWQEVFDFSSYINGVQMLLHPSNKRLSVYVDNTRTFSANYVIEYGVLYYVKVQFTGSAYIYSVSTDNVNWTEVKRTESTTKTSNSDTSKQSIGISKRYSSDRNWLGSIDLNHTYIKINSQLWFGYDFDRVKIRTAPYVRYTVVGSPTITDGVVSNLSNGTNYLQLTQQLPSVINSFEMVVRSNLGSALRGTFAYSYPTGYYRYGGFIARAMGSSVTSAQPTWRYKAMQTSSETEHILRCPAGSGIGSNANDLVYNKITMETVGENDYLYSFSQSLDGVNWTLLASQHDTYRMSGDDIGLITMTYNPNDGTGNTLYYARSIDLNNTYIKVNGQYWWRGDMQNVETYTLHSTNDYGFDSEGRLVWANKNIWLRIPVSQGSVHPSITTNYYPNNNTKIEAEIMGVDYTDIFGRSLVFAYSAGNSNIFGFRYNDNRKLNFYYNGTSYTTPNTYTTGVRTKITLDKNKAYVDDTLENTFTESTFQSTYPIKIFGWSETIPFFYSGKVYSIKIYENDILVRHFVPVPTGLQIGSFTVPSNGLFDIVTQTFFGNVGTGTFNYGKDE